MKRFWVIFVVLIVIFPGLTGGDSARVSELGCCSVVSSTDAILGFQDSVCNLNHSFSVAVIEGDEVSFQKALQLVHSHNQEYVAVLFYASWCPFSRNFRPSFSILSTLYPSIPHFAIEESTIRPSVLSKYGVHGFPTLFILNSTMLVRYRGYRSINSLVGFYSDVTAIESDPRDQLPFDTIQRASNDKKYGEEAEDCPFLWARSPEKILRQETYLALATAFVLLRLLSLLLPCLLEVARRTWQRYTENVRIRNLWELPMRYLNKTKQLFCSVRNPRKARNFQEGAKNARAWASKSLASAVSIGDASARRGH